VFARQVTNGLGTANIGGAYTVSSATTGYFVANGVGRIPGAIGANRSAYLPDVNQRDVDFLTDLTLDTKPSGSGAYVSLVARRTAPGTDYRVKVRFMPNGSVVLYLVRSVNGTETILHWNTVPGLTVEPGEAVRARFVVEGGASTTVAATLWSKNSAGPAFWLTYAIENAPKALQGNGEVGMVLYTSQSWTGRAPALTIDNFVVREH
jgi:hypothetical protein